MRVLILAVTLFATAASADVIQPPHRTCAVDDRIRATAQRDTDGFRRLDRLPAAREYLTVFRTVDRCPAPIIVRDDIGAVAPRR